MCKQQCIFSPCVYDTITGVNKLTYGIFEDHFQITPCTVVTEYSERAIVNVLTVLYTQLFLSCPLK
jgi:hypothetical protein